MPTTINANLFPLGFISPVPGTPVGIYGNFPDLADDPYTNLILFQAHPDNVGRIYIGSPSMNVALNVGVNWVLITPGDGLGLDSAAGNVWDGKKFRIDAELAGDGVFVSVHIR